MVECLLGLAIPRAVRMLPEGSDILRCPTHSLKLIASKCLSPFRAISFRANEMKACPRTLLIFKHKKARVIILME